jgi:glycosyltransferase involved in cell wall biosynthesis
MSVSEHRLFLLPNVVDTNKFCPEVHTPGKTCVVLGVGRLVQVKRFDRFLEILAELRGRANPSVRGTIIGDGPLRGELERRAAALGLTRDAIEFVGKVPDPRLSYRYGDVLLLTSDYEGTPNVVMEAMACGLPVVATNVGGLADLITHGETGFLYEPGDAANPVTLLERLLGQPRLATAVRRRARDFIEQHHSSNLLPETLVRLYSKVLAVHSS